MRSLSVALLLVVCAVLVGSVAVYAQQQHKIVADIPNAFTVAGTQLPAGSYEFELPGDLHKSIVVRSLDGKHAATGMIITGIAAGRDSQQPRLVFDVFGGTYILAEVWMPGHDGFLIAGFKNDSEHRHSTVTPSRPKP